MKEIASTLFLNTAVAVVLTAFNWLPNARGGWSQLGTLLLINLVIAQCIGSLCSVVLNRLMPMMWPRQFALRWPALIVVLLLAGLLGCMAAVGILNVTGFPLRSGAYWQVVLDIYRTAALVTLIIGIGAVVMETYRHRLRFQELETSAARLASLESRIQPHFLFNALNSVSSLIREDPARAERLVEQLASLMRSSLDTQEDSLIPLEREMKLVEDFLEIQRARFGDERIRYTLEIPAALSEVPVPPFSVQTLVENAIKFAVAPRREGGEIRVTATGDGQKLMLTVSDDGPGLPAVPLPKGHGLDNLRSRLTTLFGNRGVLEIAGSRVTISIPLTGEQRASLPA